MGKKRRLQSLGSPSQKMKLEGRGEPVMLARDRLKGALQELLDSDQESSSSEEEQQSPSKPVQVKKEPKPPVIRRRRRKAPLEEDQGFHHTYVMKLFDRSVDLAQFREDTPLYPICRAWIANQPRVPLPYPPLDSPEIKNELETSFEFDSNDGQDIQKLPPPSCPPLPTRIPPVTSPQLQGVSLDYGSEALPTAEELMKGHLSRWGSMRRQWIEAAQTNEARFQSSGKILTSMYKRSQTAFNL